MKKIVSILVIAVMLVGSLLSLASCGAPEDDGAEIAVYLGSEIYDFDPTDYYVNSNAEALMSLMYEPLFKLNANGGVEMGQAERYEVDVYEREITISLRETYWSDNTRVKAADFIYSWCERLLNPNNPNPAAALLYDIEGAAAAKAGIISPSDVSVAATGIYELTITYRDGADVEQLIKNLASVATAPLRQGVVAATPTYWSKIPSTAVSNGPFKLAKYNLVTSELTLTRNKGYHQDIETVDYDNIVIPAQLVGVTTPTGDTAQLTYSDIENKTVFYMTDAPVADRIANKANATFTDDTSVYTYVFNTTRELFAIKEVRQALSMAIDRATIVSAIGSGKAANGFVPDISGGSSLELIKSGADIDAAKALLATANLTGISKSFTLTVLDTEENVMIAELVEAAWEELGFKVTVKKVDFVETTFKASSADADDVKIKDSEIQVLAKEASFGVRDFDVLALDWQTYSTDSFVALASLSSNMNGCGKNFTEGTVRTSISGWVNADYDYLITEAYKATGADRDALLVQAEALLCEELPVCPIIFNQNLAFVSSELSGITYDGFGNAVLTRVFQNNYKVYLEKED